MTTPTPMSASNQPPRPSLRLQEIVYAIIDLPGTRMTHDEFLAAIDATCALLLQIEDAKQRSGRSTTPPGLRLALLTTPLSVRLAMLAYVLTTEDPNAMTLDELLGLMRPELDEDAAGGGS